MTGLLSVDVSSVRKPNVSSPANCTLEAASLKPSTDAGPGLGMSVEESQKFISITTGLTVVSVTSSSPQQHISISARALIVKIIPEVVLINNCGRSDDRLMLGVDMSPDQLRTKIARVKKELKTLVLSLVDVSEEDPFSFLSGWSLLPRVDKTGLYQLVVKADSRAKCALATLTNNFRVAKTLEGEEETILLVSHVLEFILFTECISTEFSVERRHSWQSKQSGTFQHKKVGPVNRCFRVKVNDVQFRKLSPAVKQFNLNILLNQFGRVIQLEQNSFGVPNNFLVVFSGNHKLDISGVEAGSGDPSLLELFPDTLPDHYIPNYGVDQHGFYSLVGKFPLGTSLGVRRKFKDSMEEIGVR